MVWRPRVALRGDAADGTGEVLLECEFFVDAGAKQYVLVHHFLDLLQQGLYDGTTATAASGVLQIGRGPAPAAPFGVESGGLGNVPRNASGMPAPKTMPTVAAPTRAITELVAAGLSTYIVFFDPRGDTAQFSICGGDSAVVPADVAQRAVMIGRLVKGFPLEPLQSLSLTAVTVLPAPTLRPVLRVSTSLGSFHIALLHQYAPVTCANIADLARSGFYDKQHIHRVVADFVVQLGCPNTSDLNGRQWGSGGPAPNTAFPPLDNTSTATMITRSASGKIPDEHVAKISNIKYNVAMANSGSPHSGGSQFFINMKHNSKLDWFNAATTSSHVVFGAVVDGYDVVDAIAAVKTNPSTDRPIDAIRIESVLLTTLDASAT